MAVVVPGNRADGAARLQAQRTQRVGQLPGAPGQVGEGVAVQAAIGLARDDLLRAELGGTVFQDGRNQQGAVHHAAGLLHCLCLLGGVLGPGQLSAWQPSNVSGCSQRRPRALVVSVTAEAAWGQNFFVSNRPQFFYTAPGWGLKASDTS